MAELGKFPVREFSIVEILSYFFPGVTLMYSLYIGGYIARPFQMASLDLTNGLNLFLLTLASYLLGYVLHVPSVMLGRYIKRFVGNPVVYLIDPDSKAVGKFKRNMRGDFPKELKRMLRSVIIDYWTDKNDRSDVSPSQYYTLCEALVEDACPNAWMIHERFYSNSNLSRAMILPVGFMGFVFLPSHVLVSLALFVSAFIFAYRFISLDTASIKQIYSGFYIFYLGHVRNGNTAA